MQQENNRVTNIISAEDYSPQQNTLHVNNGSVFISQ